jgi:hypothetical protein
MIKVNKDTTYCTRPIIKIKFPTVLIWLFRSLTQSSWHFFSPMGAIPEQRIDQTRCSQFRPDIWPGTFSCQVTSLYLLCAYKMGATCTILTPAQRQQKIEDGLWMHLSHLLLNIQSNRYNWSTRKWHKDGWRFKQSIGHILKEIATLHYFKWNENKSAIISCTRARVTTSVLISSICVTVLDLEGQMIQQRYYRAKLRLTRVWE